MTSAAVRIAVGQAIGEPASSIAAFPPLAGLEADIASVGEAARQSRNFVDIGDELSIELAVARIFPVTRVLWF